MRGHPCCKLTNNNNKVAPLSSKDHPSIHPFNQYIYEYSSSYSLYHSIGWMNHRIHMWYQWTELLLDIAYKQRGGGGSYSSHTRSRRRRWRSRQQRRCHRFGKLWNHQGMKDRIRVRRWEGQLRTGKISLRGRRERVWFEWKGSGPCCWGLQRWKLILLLQHRATETTSHSQPPLQTRAVGCFLVL